MVQISCSDRRRSATSRVRGVVELGDLAFASPTTQSRGAGEKLSRPMPFPVDQHTLRYEAEVHVVRAGECQKQLLGGRTASWPVQDGDLQVAQDVKIPHQQVDVLDRVFDGENAGVPGREQDDPVMGMVKAQISCVARPVADSRAENTGPDRQVFL